MRIRIHNNWFVYGCSEDKNSPGIKENKKFKLSSKKMVTKSITFNELCPIWSKKLSLGLDRVDKFMLEGDSKYCIVGEAWKFSAKYSGYYLALLIPFVGCLTCIKYARKFAKVSKNKNEKEHLARSDFESLIEYFMTHWNEKHMNKYRK
jgi:hypothetical protein